MAVAPPASGPEANYVSASISAFRLNNPALGRSEVAVVYSGSDEGPGLFARGKLEIAGVGTFAITNSWTLAYVNGRAGTTVEILAAPSGLAINQQVKLYDDDDQFLQDNPLYRSSLNLPSPLLPAQSRSSEAVLAMAPKYAAAYLTLVDANALGWNTGAIIPFRRAAGIGIISSVFDAGNLQLKGKDRPEFWAYSIVFGYEALRHEDGEPDLEEPLLGINADDDLTSTASGYCVAYVEGVRDKVWGLNRVDISVFEAGFVNSQASLYGQIYFDRLYAVIAHELGHAPGGSYLDHFEEGLMQGGASQLSVDSFSPKTLRRFRSATKWTP